MTTSRRISPRYRDRQGAATYRDPGEIPKRPHSSRWISAMIYGGLPEILVWPGPSSGFARTASSKEESHAGDRSRYWAAERETIDGGGSCHA